MPETVAASNSAKILDSASRDERYAAVNFALRHYFLIERMTQGRKWSDIVHNPQDFCDCYSCKGRRNTWLEDNKSVLSKIHSYSYNG